MSQMAALLIIAVNDLSSLLKSFHDKDLYGSHLRQLPQRVFDHNTKLTEL